MPNSLKRLFTVTLTASMGLAVAACGSMNMENRSLYSARQPVVERSNFVFDVGTDFDGLPLPEQQRLAQWFDTLNLGHGDRVAIDDVSGNAAIREDVAALAGRHGVLLADGAPVTEGYAQPGQVRIVVTRSSASVPGCPDWSHTADSNLFNATNPNYGCATNSNLAAMVANPEDLIKGQQGTGETVVLTSTKAIKTYREKDPTGAGELKEMNTQQGGN